MPKGRQGQGGRRRGRRRLPGVCRFYNSKGCTKGDECDFLHICRALFDDEGCPNVQEYYCYGEYDSYGEYYCNCEYNHDFTDDQTANLLEDHGIDPYQDIDDLLDLLRPGVWARKTTDLGSPQQFATDAYKDEEEDSDEDDDAMSTVSSTSQRSGTRRRNRRRNPRGKGQRRPSTATSEVSETSEPQTDASLQEICTFHVKGHCKHGDNCSKLHRPSRLPYQWQSLRDNEWKHFDKKLNESIEAAFCDTSVLGMPVKFGSRHSDNQQPNISESKLYVGNLAAEISRQELEEIFSRYGNLSRVWTGGTGFAFVDFTDAGGARTAVQALNRKEIGGKKVRVEFSKKTQTSYWVGGEPDDRKVSFTIDFDTMKFHPRASRNVCNIRRLSTMPTVSNRINNMKPYCTHWVWYWEDDQGRWKEYSAQTSPNEFCITDSNTLEKAYQKYLHQGGTAIYSLSSPEYCVKFDDMIQTVTRGNYLEVRRRPKPFTAVSDGNRQQPDMSNNLRDGGMKMGRDETRKPPELLAVQEVRKPPAQEVRKPPAQEVRKPPAQEVRKPPAQEVRKPPAQEVRKPPAQEVRKPPVSSSVPRQEKVVNTSSASASSNEAREICTMYIRDKCKHGDSCYKCHNQLRTSYQWQYKSATGWEDFDSSVNTGIEETFSKPSVDMISIGATKQTLKSMIVSNNCVKGDSIRRLSTMSTVKCRSLWLEPFCIEWLWYWKDEYGNWIQYAQKNSTDMQSDVDGNKLEMAYEDYLEGHGATVYPFSTHKNNYNLNFQTMFQRNIKYTTEREVRRRPKYLAMAERRQLASQQKFQERRQDTSGVPKTWDMKGMTNNNEPKLIPLYSQNEEYKEVARLFGVTMDAKNATISAIKRVQNLELWEDFSKKRERMTKKCGTSSSVRDNKLWHGTKKDSSMAICQQNFDFRISGSNVGTLYGQGSYFARDASYSDSYSTPENGICRMFLARVLVGSSVVGKSEYKRPPPIDPNKPLGDLHDSCVDNVYNQSIFVIFDKSQYYPEYLIEYRRSGTSSASVRPSVPSASIPSASVRYLTSARPSAPSTSTPRASVRPSVPSASIPSASVRSLASARPSAPSASTPSASVRVPVPPPPRSTSIRSGIASTSATSRSSMSPSNSSTGYTGLTPGYTGSSSGYTGSSSGYTGSSSGYTGSSSGYTGSSSGYAGSSPGYTIRSSPSYTGSSSSSSSSSRPTNSSNKEKKCVIQ